MWIRRTFKTLIFVAVFGGAAYGLFKTGAFSPDREPPRVVPTATAGKSDIQDNVFASGAVSPIDQTDIRSEVSGLVMHLKVTPGQHVKKDDPLIQLDDRDLQSQANEINFQLAADQLKSKQATADLNRARDLVGKGFIPQKEYDDADVTAKLAENDLLVLHAHLETLKQQIIKTDLHAPHDGIILRVDTREGEVITGATSVNNGKVLMKIADLSRLKVDTAFSEVDVVKLKVKDHVDLTFDAVPGLTMPGYVTYISPSAESANSGSSDSGGSNNGQSASTGGPKTFDSIVFLDGNDPRIRPGITAHLAIPLQKVTGVLTVPVMAIFSDGGDSYVFFKNGEAFDRHPVETGLSDGNIIEVKTGLKAGDVVATERPGTDMPTPTPPRGRH